MLSGPPLAGDGRERQRCCGEHRCELTGLHFCLPELASARRRNSACNTVNGGVCKTGSGTSVPAYVTVTERSAVVIGAGIVVALRRRGGEAQGLGRLAERADLVGDVVLVDLDALKAADQRLLELARLDRLLRRPRAARRPDSCRGRDRWSARRRPKSAARAARDSRTSSKRFGTLSTQSSTVTRAMRLLHSDYRPAGRPARLAAGSQ